MYILESEKRRSIQIRLDGKDKNDKNTTRIIRVVDAEIDTLDGIIRKAIKDAAASPELLPTQLPKEK